MAAPIATVSVQQMCNALARSRLMSPDDVRTVYRQFQEEAKENAEDADLFRKFLVSKNLLTEYQAALISRGHSDNFFLGPYKILDRIGKGRMAGVYKAVHNLGQIVAIKALPPSKAKDPKVLSRFQREARMATQLDHPNIVRSFQVGESNGVHHIVMEYLEGETLDEVLARRGRLPVPEAVRIVVQTLVGLQQVYEKRLVHRDLKPANLMLVPPPCDQPNDTTLNSTVKILDIGLGRTIWDEEETPENPETQLTTEGVLLGTPDYLAPEQARDARQADIRSDIYSLGCMLYHLLTGQPPFRDANVLTQMMKHATETARPLSEFIQPVPEGLQAVLNTMMAKDPDHRYQTPAEAAQALRVFLPNQPTAAVVSGKFMDSYLNWLKTSETDEAPTMDLPTSGGGASAKAASASMSGVLRKGPAAPPATAATTKPAETQTNPARSGRLVTGRSAGASGVLAKKAGLPPPPPVQPPPLREDEIDVELIAMPVPSSEPPAPVERELTDLDRRDVIMLSAGGGAVFFAIVCGWGLSRLIGGGSRVEPEDEPKETKSEPKPTTPPATKTKTNPNPPPAKEPQGNPADKGAMPNPESEPRPKLNPTGKKKDEMPNEMMKND